MGNRDFDPNDAELGWTPATLPTESQIRRKQVAAGFDAPMYRILIGQQDNAEMPVWFFRRQGIDRYIDG